LQQQAERVFASSLDRAKEQDVEKYLYITQETATASLWEQIHGPTLQSTYNEYFNDFLRRNLLSEVQFWFGEELKTNNRESNRAWRAFQRLLLEGIQADIKAVQANQDLIRQDLQKLEELSSRLDRLRDTIDYRLPDEPFQQGLEKAVNQMHAILEDLAQIVSQFGTLTRYFAEALPSIRSEIRDYTFIIEDRTQSFVGRQSIFEAIERFIAESPRGYVVIHGQPGIGKTALAAQLLCLQQSFWDYRNPEQCTFDVEHLGAQSREIPTAEEKKWQLDTSATSIAINSYLQHFALRFSVRVINLFR
jgi:hypothetical protein